MRLPYDDLHQRFTERRSRLNAHLQRMHDPREPSRLTVHQLMGRLLRLGDVPRATTRWRGSALMALDAATVDAVADLLHEASGFGRLLTRDDPSPWTGACLPDEHTVLQVKDAVQRLLATHLPRLQAALQALADAQHLPVPANGEQAARMVERLAEVSETLALYEPELFSVDLVALARDLAPAGDGWLAHGWAMVANGAYRTAGRAAREHRKERHVPAALLLTEIQAAVERTGRWREAYGATPLPRQPVDTSAVRQLLDALQAEIAPLAAAFPERRLETTALEELREWTAALAADAETPHRLPRLGQIEDVIGRHGAAAILDELRTLRLPAAQWPAFFRGAWLASGLDQTRQDDPQIAGFNGPVHAEIVDEFRGLDRRRLTLAAARVRRAHAEHVIRAMNEFPDQEALVRRQLNRKRHLPMRTLLAQAPDVLTALCPCWMASPLSVSQLLPGDQCCFDVVIFDEASQVLPHDAVPALFRASQAIVAGDEHQLSPTLFFADGGLADGADDEENAAGAYASLLQMMRAVTGRPLPLRWHYRSRDEALIAFSNRHIYAPDGQEMITLPSPHRHEAVRHVLVEPEPDRDGEEESSAAEVRRVVELVLEHAEQRPEETLGVIAMGITHALRLQAALDEALRARPDLEEFFDEQRPERFVIKNLERVQGDEREAILLSIGYGKDRSGKLLYRFGPLNQEGGHRRLNVAVTRARRRLTLVSSFSHLDMDPARCRRRGVELLRLYLQFAASGGRTLGEGSTTEHPLNDFEADIRDALTQRGMRLLPQVGASRYRIDLVAQHLERPGRLVLAIECDGATYHAAPTARDRDRLRQEHLEALGWRFHRIWSTDWFMRRDEEIARAWSAYEAAVSHADAEDARAEVAPPEAQPAPEPPSALPAAEPAPTQRQPRPPVARKANIAHYAPSELVALVEWLASDGRLRTDEELLTELIPELGFQRRGPRIEAACREAIRRWRAKGR